MYYFFSLRLKFKAEIEWFDFISPIHLRFYPVLFYNGDLLKSKMTFFILRRIIK